MTAPTFDSLITRHEMGQAYLAITQAMGVSAQLLAFVNYDRITDEGLGLEAFGTIAEQHETVLESIKADTSHAQAMKMLSDHLQMTLDGTYSEIAVEGFIGKFFRKLFVGLPSYTSYSNSKRYVKISHDYVKAMISEMPSNLNEAAWVKYNAKIAKQLETLNHEVDAIMGKKINNQEYDNAVSFKKSGWDRSKYEAERRWLESVEKEAAAFTKAHQGKIEKVKKLVDENSAKTDKESTSVAKLINVHILKVDGLIEDLKVLSKFVGPTLDKVEKFLD